VVSKDPLNLQLTVAGVAILAVLAGALWFGFGPTLEPPQTVSAVSELPSVAAVTVHVSGAVLRAGVVVVAAGARVADVVAAAGGASADADLTKVNLAAVVRDGERISVPSYVESLSAGQVESGGLDLNTATPGQLEELDGVGPVLARRIADFRQENGPYESVEDLLDVPGIGEAKLAAMRGGIDYP